MAYTFSKTFAIEPRLLVFAAVLVFVFFGQAFGADEDISFRLLVTDDKGTRELKDASVKGRHQWSANSESARVLQWKILIKIPNYDFNALKPQVESERISVRYKGDSLWVSTTSLNNVIRLNNGQKLNVQIIGTPGLQVVERCEREGLVLRKKGRAAPFYIGASCANKTGQVTLHLNFPAEADLTNSTLFENLGKGENFRVYELKKVTAAKREIGEFTFTYANQKFTYALISLKAKTKDAAKPPSKFSVALGAGPFELAIEGGSFEDTKQVLFLRFLPQKAWRSLVFGATAEGAFGGKASDDENSFTYLQLGGHAGYVMKVLKSWEFQPRGYFISSDQSSGTGIDYHTSQAGVGVFNRLQLGKRLSLDLEYFTEAVGSEVIEAHTFIRLGAFYKDENDNSGWGTFFQTQDYEVVDSAENKRKFSQMLLAVEKRF